MSPAPDAPTFLIPTFTRHGSNSVFVQDLDAFGIIKGFAVVDPSLFYSVPHLPPYLQLSERQPGLLAYWAEKGRVVLGGSATMTDILAKEQPNDPFAELELGSLLGEQDIVASATREIAALFSNQAIADSWRSRELNVFRLNAESARLELNTANEVHPSAEDKAFQQLLNEPESERWAEGWQVLWRRKYKLSELEQVAFWWMETGYGASSSDAHLVLEPLVRNSYPGKAADYAMTWLEQFQLDKGWYSLWIAVLGRGGTRGRVGTLALDRLREGQIGWISTVWQWVWSTLWRWNYAREQLVPLAKRLLDNDETPSASVAEDILRPLLASNFADEEFARLARAWLQNNIRSLAVWPDLYIRGAKYFSDVNYASLGQEWLRFCGGNLNGWVDVWRLLSPQLSDLSQIQLANDWLQRSRWDLRTWPQVFVLAAQLEGSENDLRQLLNVGRRWSSTQTSSARTKSVRKAMSLIENRLEHLSSPPND